MHNAQYIGYTERSNHLPNHSTRGPNEEWIKYRDDPSFGFSGNIQLFEQFATFWMEKYQYSRNDMLLVSYEELIDDDLGPTTSIRMADFLGETEGVEPLPRDLIPCAWHKVVKYKEMKLRMENESNTKRRRRTQEGNNNNAQYSLREGPKRRPYTAAQLAEMLSMFHRLLLKFSGDSVFVSVISSYIEAVSSTLPVDG